MTPARTEILVFLSASPTTARDELKTLLEKHSGDRITVYLRQSDRAHFEDLLSSCLVQSDKPTRGKRNFVRDIRAHLYDEAIVLDFGEWSFFPARCLFFLSRAERKTVRTERGEFEFSLLKPITLLRHLLWRSKHRSGAVAGMPPGMPAPFAFAVYRKTIGFAIGVVTTLAEYTWRRFSR